MKWHVSITRRRTLLLVTLMRISVATLSLATLAACSSAGTFNQAGLQKTLTSELKAKGYTVTVTCPKVQDHDKANATYVCTAKDATATRYVTVTRNSDRSGFSWALTPKV